MDTPRSSRPTNRYGTPIARPCPRYGWRPRRGESHPRRLTSSAHPFRPWPALCLGCLLPWLPAWASADTLTAAMTAVTARVLCLPSDGDPHTGSGFILGDGTHLVTNWHVVACTREGGQALVPIRQQFSSPSRARRGVLARSPISSRASVPTGRAAASWLGIWAPALGRGHFSGTRSAHRPAANCLARCPWRG